MNYRSRFRAFLSIISVIVVSMTAVIAAGQSTTATPQKVTVPEKFSDAQPEDVSGNWQIAWETRLGTNSVTVHLQQDGKKLTGTFKDLHGLSSLSGTIDLNQISFDVQFQGPKPFTTRFSGKVIGDKIEGTSGAVNVTDGGAYLGHAGEIVHPDHPWTATRVAKEPISSGSTTPEPKAATKN